MLGCYATLHVHAAFAICFILDTHGRYTVEAIRGRHRLAASRTMELISSLIVSDVTRTCEMRKSIIRA